MRRACATRDSHASRKRRWRNCSPRKWPSVSAPTRSRSTADTATSPTFLSSASTATCACARSTKAPATYSGWSSAAPWSHNRGRKMSSPIDFYFDFSSPYGYLASERIEALAVKHGRGVNFRPVLLGVVFKQTGAMPLTQVPLKGDYSRRDMERSARFHGIPDFRMPSKFPIPSQAAARIVLWVQQRDAAVAARVVHALYHAFFADDRDISDPDTA